MATLEPNAAVAQAVPLEGGAGLVCGPTGWKRRLEDPFNTFYRYPLALALTRLLLPTAITPNQISLVQPVFAAVAGWLLTLPDARYHLGAVVLFELRSILDCVDGSLARAKRLSSPNGHAIDAVADWLGVLFLYAGIFHHVYHRADLGMAPSVALLVVAAALVQGGLRSFAADYFKAKYLGIFERGCDEVVETLADKLRAARDGRGAFARVDAFILRMGHLLFELSPYQPGKTRPLSSEQVARMRSEESSLRTRLVAAAWSVSGGDAFLSFVMLSIALGQIWPAQLFFASVGSLWIVLVVVLNVAFVKSYAVRAAQPTALP